ncbi:MAG: phytoene/squalene synthase family protein [Betaproteobacteria bacterium]
MNKVVELAPTAGEALATAPPSADAATLAGLASAESVHRPAFELEADDAFQARMLAGVSRTFALTIPQLPQPLARVVSNAYLLCRIVDTIEDEPDVCPSLKSALCAQFVAAVAGSRSAQRFSTQMLPLLSEHTGPVGRELIEQADRVVAITHRFSSTQRRALLDCVVTMGAGMVKFQESPPHGLVDMRALDNYCYYVAGVVGEMLTELFCEHSAALRPKREAMLRLAVSFGQGLQMTNIIKDIWEDLERGMCWLPRDVFAAEGVDVATLTPDQSTSGFQRGLVKLIAIAHGHLHNALRYTLHIPARETGMRNFCLWSIGMALLTLAKINAHLDFSSGEAVKISRRSVRAVIVSTRLAVRSDTALRLLFRLAATRLPPAPAAER